MLSTPKNLYSAGIVKNKVFLVLNKVPSHEDVWGVEVQLHAFLTSALDGGECSTSCLGRFTPRERALGTHWIGGWVGPRAGLDAVAEKKKPAPASNQTPDVKPVA
jgi:hypothetical protein